METDRKNNLPLPQVRYTTAAHPAGPGISLSITHDDVITLMVALGHVGPHTPDAGTNMFAERISNITEAIRTFYEEKSEIDLNEVLDQEETLFYEQDEDRQEHTTQRIWPTGYVISDDIILASNPEYCIPIWEPETDPAELPS